jgi:large subunit ribosomal protein L21
MNMEIAVIKTGGKQYIVSPGKKIKIEKIEGKAGDKATFEEVLLTAEICGTETRKDAETKDAEVKIGQPLIKGAKVTGKIIEQGRADKVIIFKYKPKKRYKVKKGHRQAFSMVEIESIEVAGSDK